MDGLNRYALTALRALEATGRLGSLARAAEELGVTVGAVSQHILARPRRNSAAASSSARLATCERRPRAPSCSPR